jgi:hypothetical protein
LCSSEDMQAHDDIYQCPVVWKGRNSTATNGSAVTYAAGVRSSTSASASASTSITHSSTASARPTLSPGATTPQEDVLVVGSGHEAVDNDNPNSLDHGSRSSDAGALTARDGNIEWDANHVSWRRGIPVESVFSDTLVQPGSASTESDLVGVSLPTFMNVTTGTMGIVLSEQCVQMIVWPNQM